MISVLADCGVAERLLALFLRLQWRWEFDMIGVVALVRVRDGKGEEFETVFSDLLKNVRANEPGNIAYTLSRKQGSTTEYVIQELYADQAAVSAHTRAAYFREARPHLEACFAEPPTIHLIEPRVS